MSRIGRLPITVPAGVKVDINGSEVTVKGPKGEMKRLFSPIITIEQEGNEITVKRSSDEASVRALHGTTRALLHNMVVGVSEGYKKTLEMRGIGYKAQMKGQAVEIWAGYSHTVVINPEEGVKITLPNATDIEVEGIDKQKVGQTAALIREVRPPEPYLGKGIRYKDEVVITKEGKRAGAGK